MKKTIVCVLFICTALISMPERSHASFLTYDADASGVAINFKTFPMWQTREFFLQAPANGEAQTITLHMGLFSVDLTLTDLMPGGRPYFKMKWVVKSLLITPWRQQGTISLPFGHGGATNSRWFYNKQEFDQFDVKGVFTVLPFNSNFEIQFGLFNLSGLFIEETGGRKNNTIFAVIERDNGNELADINLTFKPSALLPDVTRIQCNVKVTPDSGTLPDEVFAFNGVLPVRYDSYFFWFYRDK